MNAQRLPLNVHVTKPRPKHLPRISRMLADGLSISALIGVIRGEFSA